MLKRYYLAYGSNLNLNQMLNRCKNAKQIGTMMLNDYRLVYKGSKDSYAYLTIEKSPNSFVPIGIYQVSLSDIYFLDMYEGYPDFYSKFYVPINIGNKTHKALIYIMNENFDYHLPSLKYIDICSKGYDDFGFDKSILNDALNYTIEKINEIPKTKTKNYKFKNNY